MTIAHFYQTTGGYDKRDSVAALLTEQNYQQRKRVLILCDNKEQALTFDEYLWTFKPSSFIPHNLLSDSMTPPPPVMVATIDETLPYADILVNLSTSLIEKPNRFKHIIEIICDIEEEKQRLRDFYRQYQAHGIKREFIANFSHKGHEKVMAS